MIRFGAVSLALIGGITAALPAPADADDVLARLRAAVAEAPAGPERVEHRARLAEALSDDSPEEALETAEAAVAEAAPLGPRARERALRALGLVHVRGGRLDEGADALRAALELVEGDDDAAAPARVYLAGVRAAQARVADSEALLALAAGPIERGGSSEQRAWLCNVRAVLHQTHFEIDEALEDYLAALDHAEAAGNRSMQRRLHYNIGTVRWNVDDLAGARASLERALELAEPLGASRSSGLLLCGLGQLAAEEGDVDAARASFGRALALSERCGARDLVALAHRHLGDLALDEGRAREALGGYERSLELSRAVGNDEAVASSLASVARARLALDDPRAALVAARAAWSVVGRLDMPVATEDVAAVMSDAHAAVGDFEGALRFHREYVRVHSAIEAEMRTAATARLEVRQARRDAERDREAARAEIDAQRRARNLALLGSGGLLGLLALAALAWRHARALNRELAGQNDRIARTNEQVVELNEGLGRALDEVKRLSGLLPICSRCKDIRDDQGCWRRIERYISDRSEARFTHSLCPRCAETLFPMMWVEDPE